MSLIADASGPWPVISLLIFLALFAGMLAWLWIVPRSRWQRAARMPLEEVPVQTRSKETDG